MIFSAVNDQEILGWFNELSKSELREIGISVAAVLGMVLSGWFSSFGQKRKQRALLEQLAMRYNGDVHQGSLFSWARLMLNSSFGEVQVFATSGSRGRLSGTFFVADLQASLDFECLVGRLSPQHFMGIFSKRKILKINSPAFDECFVIQTNDPDRIVPLLTVEVQSNLLGLKELDPRVQIRRGKMTFSLTKMMETERQYDDFIAAGMMLFQRANEIA